MIDFRCFFQIALKLKFGRSLSQKHVTRYLSTITTIATSCLGPNSVDRGNFYLTENIHPKIAKEVATEKTTSLIDGHNLSLTTPTSPNSDHLQIRNQSLEMANAAQGLTADLSE